MQGLLQSRIPGPNILSRDREETHKNGGKQPGKNRGNVWFALDGTG